MSLFSDFKEWQEKFIALQQEGASLQERIGELEKQNAELRQKLASGDSQGDGFTALKGLYDDGFHICPGSFGQERDEECLFCLNFLLHKEQK